MDKAKVREMATALSKKLADEGRLVEGGWMAMKLISIPVNASEEQLKAMREAFFFGAEHLFASIMSIMDEDREPTDADMKKMDLIQKELAQFVRSIRK